MASVIFDLIPGNWTSFLSSALLLIGVFIVGQGIRDWHRLRYFKGPFSTSFSKWWLVRAVSGGNIHLEMQGVTERYGSLARVGPNHLITSDPDVMRRMLSVRSPYRRSDWYVAARFIPTKDNVGSQRDEELHTQLRAKMAAGYSGKEVENFEEIIDQSVAALVKLVGKYVSSKYKPMDFGRKAQYFTLDTISSVAYGKAFGYLESDSDLYDYIQTVEEVFPYVMVITALPWINWVMRLDFIQKYLPSAKDSIGFGKILGVVHGIVGERYGAEKKTVPDMLGSFVAHGLTQEEAESETVLQIVAGSDTTATAVRATFLYIITNPPILSKLRAEISSHSISSPIKDAEARKLPYLQAIIKEGFRICPPLVSLMSKEVPPGGDVIKGKFIPGGVSIGYCAFGIFRDKTIWGEDADVFRPERWLEGEPEGIKKLESVLDLIFGGGRWQCLGRNVAQMELNKIFVELLRNFDFAIVDPTKPWRSLCYGIFSQSEFWVTVKRREDL